MARTRAQASARHSGKKSSAIASGSAASIKAPNTDTHTHAARPETDRLRHDIRSNLYRLISRTQPASTICPSQVARALHADDKRIYPDWRALMDPVRELVWQDVKVGKLQVTQKGEVRAYEERRGIKGPIRVKRGPKWGEVDVDPRDEDVDGDDEVVNDEPKNGLEG